MIHHCKDDGAVLVHFALNNKYWCPKCKLYRTRREAAFIKGGKDELRSDTAGMGSVQPDAGADR